MLQNRQAVRSAAIISILVAAASALWLAVPHGDPKSESSGSLDVEIASPRGDVPALHSIDVVFDAPMIALGARAREKGKAPLLLDPPLQGSFSWIGTRALSFIPRSPVPAGTRIVCRVPRGTAALGGEALAADYVWEIVVGRPRLLRSIPAQGGMLAPDEPLYLLFNATPAPSAADSILLTGPSGAMRLRPAAVDSMAIREFFRGGERAEPQRILALRPEAPIAPGRTYRLSVPAGLPFLSSAVGIREPLAIEFTSFGPPVPVSIHADVDGFMLGLAGPVDPEALQSRLTLLPPAGEMSVRPVPGSRFVGSPGGGRPEASYRVQVRLRPGASYTLAIKAGLTTLLGESLSSDAQIGFTVPHLHHELRIVPAGGYLPRAPEPFIRIEGTNVDTVEVFGAWVAPDSVDARLTGSARRLARPRLPLLARWIEPRETPDSSRAVHIPLSKLGPAPAAGRVLHLRARARPLHRSPQGARDLLRDDALIQITDLGLSIMSGEGPGIAWVTSLSKGKPVGGAEVLLRVPGAPTHSWSGVTDSEGLVWLPPMRDLQLPDETPLVAQVRLGKDAAWIELSRYGWTSWDDGHGGGGNRAFAFTDRPLYRPGETAHWITHLRRASHAGLAAAAVDAVFYSIRGPDGAIVDRGRIPLTAPGGGSGSYNIPAGATLGDHSIAFSMTGGDEASEIGWASFQVQEYKLPRFEARLERPDGYAVSGSTAHVEGRFSYLGGGPLAGAPVRWTLSRHTYWSRPRGYGDFAFHDERPAGGDDTGEWRGMTRLASGEGVLDAEGRTRLPVIPDLSGLSEDQTYVLEMGARDITDRSAYDVVSFPALRAAVRVGARAVFDPDRRDETIEFSAVALDTTDKPIEGREIRWKIERREWRTVRVRRIGSVFGYENVPHDEVIEEGKFTSARDPVVLRYRPSSPGSYSFVAEANDLEGRTTRARDAIYVSGREAASWYRDDAGWLDLKSDKKSYAPGDTASILIPGPAVPTEGLLLVLDEGVQRAVRISRLEGSPRIPVPLSGLAPSGPTVHTVLVGPTLVPQGADGKRRLPYHGWGAIPLQIRDEDWRLRVSVVPDRNAYEPGEEVAVLIDLREISGGPVDGEVALAVVDDAIFELIEADDPDPVATFLASRGTGVDYDDIRFRLSLSPRGEKGALTPGGGGGGGALGLRKRFAPTVHWDPSVKVGPDGKATVRFRLADDLTRYRFRALASSGIDRFGYGEAKVDVRKPIQIEWGAPRFAREGDRIEIAAAVRSHLDRKIEVKLEAKAEGARIEGGSA
ncbi:MAG: hypothetical protein FJY88_10315, partial [Candidatus Eisenbacteria bacterium]|nr:hypothetical protein [Candidatus Eisenbacteria bacterium]